MLFVRLIGKMNPLGGPFAVLFSGKPTLHPHPWEDVLMPGVSGAVVLLAIAAVKIRVDTVLRRLIKCKQKAT